MAAVPFAALVFAVSASASVFVVRWLDSRPAERIVERRLQILGRSEL
jgi:hypothetical protein